MPSSSEHLSTHLLDQFNKLLLEGYSENRWNPFIKTLQNELPQDLLTIVNSSLIQLQKIKKRDQDLIYTAKLFEISQQLSLEITSLAPLDKILTMTVDRIRETTKMDLVSIGFLNKAQNDFSIPVISGAFKEDPRTFKLQVGVGLAGNVAKHKEVMMVSDYLLDPLLETDSSNVDILRKEMIRTAIAAPLIVKNECIGVLYIGSRKVRTVSETEKSLLAHLCNEISIAIENAKLYENELRISSFHEQITRAALQNGYSEMIQQLSDLLGHPIMLMDEFGDILHRTVPVDFQKNNRECFSDSNRLFQFINSKKIQLHKLTEFELKNLSYLVTPISLNERAVGYIIILKENHQLDHVGIMALEQAANIIALKINQERTSVEVELRLRKDYLYDIIFSTESEESLIRRGRYLGIRFQQQYQIIILHVFGEKTHAESKHIIESFEKIRFILGNRKTLLSMVQGEKLVVIASSQQANTVSKDILTYFKQYYPGVRAIIGISTNVLHPKDYSQGYTEAQKAAEFTHYMGKKNEIVHFEELGFIGLLFKANNQEAMKDFCEKILGTLIFNESKNSMVLLQTLEVFLNNESVIQSTAKELDIHYNTLRYRLNRIEEISGFQLSDPHTRLNIQLAIGIYRLYYTQS